LFISQSIALFVRKLVLFNKVLELILNCSAVSAILISLIGSYIGENVIDIPRFICCSVFAVTLLEALELGLDFS